MGKSEAAFRTISEVAEELDVPQHVLRFWEGRFSQLKPLKRAGGRRYYRPEDVDLLKRIRELLYQQGYTIKGVQKLLREGKALDAGPSAPKNGSPTSLPSAPGKVPAGQLSLLPVVSHKQDAKETLTELLAELLDLKETLLKAGGAVRS
ncbi:MAG: MerR family transcriptional regulator [Alphaproteobacteria bacterium]|nr:MerR family transcriptional regulator [Alphaproteobacteria bacterium]